MWQDNHSEHSDHSSDQPHSVLDLQSGESNELGLDGCTWRILRMSFVGNLGKSVEEKCNELVSEYNLRGIRLRTHFPTLCCRELVDNFLCFVINELGILFIITKRLIHQENVTFRVLNL